MFVLFSAVQCPAGQARSDIHYELVYRGIYDNTIVVGPRAVQDIHSGPHATEQYVLSNPSFVPLYTGYFEQTYDFVPPQCDYVAGTCTTSFSRMSECRPLLPEHNGDTFITNDAGHYLAGAGSGYFALDAQPLVVNGQHQVSR